MNDVKDVGNIIVQSLQSFFTATIDFMPRMVGAIILLIVGWLVAKILSGIVKKSLIAIGAQTLFDKMGTLPLLDSPNFKIDGPKIISKIVYWVIFSGFLMTFFNTLGLQEVTEGIKAIIAYLPKLITALIIFVVGLWIGSFVRTAIYSALHSLDLSSAKIISNLVFGLIIIFVAITALTQAGINTSPITTNLATIIAAVGMGFAIAFGLGAKDILRNMLSASYSKNNFAEGDLIRVMGIEGTITKLDNVSCVLQSGAKEVVIPASKLLSETVEKL
jgi:small-conductance mechanosensitive channel